MAPLDEEEILTAVAAQNNRLPSTVLIAPGDDMALLELPSRRLLSAVDQVVVGVHVLATTPLELIARKAVARNISDVAAMGGLPVALLACATLPRGMSQESAAELLDSVRRWGEDFGSPLIGGDTTIHADASAPLVLSITVLATTRADGVVLTRSGAQVGDQLIISGPLGGSFGEDGLGRHLTFTPRVPEAQELIDALGSNVHALIDLSDGLGVDCTRMMRASSQSCGTLLQAHLIAEQIPCNCGVTLRGALADGEDYELLAAIGSNAAAPAGFSVIGRVVARPVGDTRPTLVLIGDECEDASQCGWTHGSA
ncbi:MAG: thiamine-monophosphate kinase [Phycisphaerales bacterium]|nr:thiamine-monophosphate kinase [Phycisphaerales bacterium]